jgi:hypothetical protein
VGHWADLLHPGRRRSDAKRAALAAARDEPLEPAGGHAAPSERASSPELIPTYDEAARHPADRLLPSEMWSPGRAVFGRDDVT